MEFIDSHCHLNFGEFDPDRDEVVDRARQNGIVRIVIPAVDIESSKTAIRYAQKYPEVFAAVGVHPNSGQSWTKDSLSELKVLAREPKVVAIGEIGLDYYRDYCPINIQQTILSDQLKLAADLVLPVIIHFRQSAEDISAMLESWHNSLVNVGSLLSNHPGVLHSFSGDLAMAKELATFNFKLGIGGPLTYKNSAMLSEIVSALPLTSFLLETDAPYLSPQPYRGKRNEPTNVRIVAEKIADLKELPVEQVAMVTTQEASSLFGWGGSH